MKTVAEIVQHELNESPEMSKPLPVDYLTPTTSLLELKSDCCPFPFPDLQCCGRPKAPEKNWCEYHHQLSHIPTKPIKTEKEKKPQNLKYVAGIPTFS